MRQLDTWLGVQPTYLNKFPLNSVRFSLDSSPVVPLADLGGEIECLEVLQRFERESGARVVVRCWEQPHEEELLPEVPCLWA